VTPIVREHLEPLEGRSAGELGATVPLGATLEEALAVLLRDDKAVVGVTDGPQFVGVLTPNGIHRALRASLAE
jgi:osmoprotectant transport system ATP-binding protein